MIVRFLMVSAAMLALTAPAMAMVKVTNLSNTPQRVVLRAAGSETVKIIQPQATEQFAGPEGLISLAADGRPSDPNTLAFSGMLGGVVGALRTENIPASTTDEFVIWPDGRLMKQKRRTGASGNR